MANFDVKFHTPLYCAADFTIHNQQIHKLFAGMNSMNLEVYESGAGWFTCDFTLIKMICENAVMNRMINEEQYGKTNVINTITIKKQQPASECCGAAGLLCPCSKCRETMSHQKGDAVRRCPCSECRKIMSQE